MKKLIFVLLSAVLLTFGLMVLLEAQESLPYSVVNFSGDTVAAKLTAAMVGCSVEHPCTLIIDASW